MDERKKVLEIEDFFCSEETVWLLTIGIIFEYQLERNGK